MLLARNEVDGVTRVNDHEYTSQYLSGLFWKIRTLRDGIRGGIRTTTIHVGVVHLCRQLAETLGIAGCLGGDSVTAFLERIRVFYPGLEWQIAIHSSVTLSADENMLRQVLINLIKNACEAGATRIDVRWKEELWVSNNGARIPVEVAREMFIPFFTTKRSGSGIGLSLSRQLMMRQGGDLRLAERAVPGYSVTFILTFSNPFS